MLFKLFLLFTIVPLIELALLIKIGSYIGTFTTIAIVILTGIFGSALARYEGFTVIQKIKANLSQGNIPSNELIDGLLILIGGFLLITPGYLTDIMGLIIIIPFTRKLVREYLKKYFKNKIQNPLIHINYNDHENHDNP